MHRKKGFTLMELIIVVIIIGILAMIGMPQFFNVAERGRASEGFETLGTIRSAQLRYAAEQQDNKTLANAACAGLDVTVPALKYFNAPACLGVTAPAAAGAAANIATIKRNSATTPYVISIQGGGTMTCAGAGCPPMPK